MADTKPKELNSTPSRTNQTFLGPSIRIRGELTANEDLVLEGQCEGNISLGEHCLTLGAQGRVKGEIRARQVVLHGSTEGNISATQRIEIRKTGHAVGDLVTPSIAIEEGGFLKGSIDISREKEKPQGGSVPGVPGTEAKARDAFGVIRLREDVKTNDHDGEATHRAGGDTAPPKVPEGAPPAGS